MPVTSSNPTRDFFFFLPVFSFFLPIFSHSFNEMKKVSIILLCILTSFIQLYSIKHMHIELL